ncbi:LacI family DNA-binding transcriptional regulator [Streptantibioticus silvisoli]|uniref:LacI family DNA-binding transcriptional regulator n=1 Tax=Streptantibioticus silvisoli TaxID=2705255 RepID=A0ABT6W2Y8_9ACTN|nr:LacI family DNA-binding transcriptional regulator [Streptantibioticus silvisoli]MDI5964352.1 LacI family DNA-binding transcriptional regulator [Streptantibioticus silvisoli]
MADVAAAAGVSITTVSHVLNNTRPVSDELRRRVLAAVEESGYTTNGVARALATRNTMLIGVVMSFLSNPFFAPLVSAIEKTARRNGYTLLLTDNHENAADETTQVGIMLDRRVDGVILAPAAAHAEPVLDLLTRRGTPTVLVDRFADHRFDEVCVENVEATAGLVTHLTGIGHTRVGLVSGRAGLSTTAERLTGYREGLERAGLPFDRALVRSGSSRVAPATEAVKALMASADPPTAIVSANNAMTVGVLRGLRELGVQVPADVAVVSFDDIAWADLMNPSLTAVAQPIAEMGNLAAKTLIKRIGGYAGPPEHRTLAPTFQHRQSCGCPVPGSTS